MQWIAIVLMILRFLNDLRKADSKEALMATSELAREIGDGKILDWVWEHREEIMAFILKIIELFSEKPMLFGDAEDDDPAELELEIARLTEE